MRWLEGLKFVVTEITPKGYEYRIILSEARYREPFEYAYFFEKDKFREEIPLQKWKNESLKNVNRTNYKELKKLRFSRMNLFVNSLVTGKSKIIGDVYFVDPLRYNQLSLRGENDSLETDYLFSFNYLNTKNLLQWGGKVELESVTVGANVTSSEQFRPFQIILLKERMT